jgi:glutamate 5-kinase
LRSIKDAKRVVVKVGTSTLTYENGRSNLRRMRQLAAVLSDLQNAGREIVLVSSGAIGVGAGKLGLKDHPRDTRASQALAAVGQCELMFLYDKFFGEYGHTVGQLILTRDDVETPQRRENLVSTFAELFRYGIIPIVNENDSLATEEIEFGDNDALSAIVAKLVQADTLVLLTDIDGLFSGNPAEDENAQLIPVVQHVDENILSFGGGSGTRRGKGGMQTKLQAAKFATEAGIDTVICNGAYPENLYQLFDGRQVGTLFLKQ